jgi:hypothetical protein
MISTDYSTRIHADDFTGSKVKFLGLQEKFLLQLKVEPIYCLGELWQYTEDRRIIFLRVCAFCGDETMGNERLLVRSFPRFGLIGTSREPTLEGELFSDLRHSMKIREQYQYITLDPGIITMDRSPQMPC